MNMLNVFSSEEFTLLLWPSIGCTGYWITPLSNWASVALFIIWAILTLLSAITYGPLLLAFGRLKAGMPPLPPGSMGLPYWGESLDYLNSWANRLNPDIWYDIRRAKHGNVFETHILGSPTVVMLGPEANKFILINENKLFDNSWPKSTKVLNGYNSVITVLGEEHMRLRRVSQSVLGAEAMKKSVGRIEKMVIQHLDSNWQKGQTIHAHRNIKTMALCVAAEFLMGLKPGQALDDFRRHYAIFDLGLFSQPLDFRWTVFGKAKRARAILVRRIHEQIEIRKQLKMQATAVGKWNEESTFLDMLLSARDNENGFRFSEEEISDNILSLRIGAQDTTASALATILKYIAQNPEIRVSDEKKEGEALTWNEVKSIEYLRNVISEGLRIVAPVNGAFKQAKTDIVYGAYTIPKGWKGHMLWLPAVVELLSNLERLQK
eukprot:Gb_29433 [translate_table: standard]